MKIVSSEIVWMQQYLAPKSGQVWGWLYSGPNAFAYSGTVELIDGTIGLNLVWDEQQSGFKMRESSILMEYMKQGEYLQVCSTDDMTKFLFGTDFKKLVINSLVYHKLQRDVDAVNQD